VHSIINNLMAIIFIILSMSMAVGTSYWE